MKYIKIIVLIILSLTFLACPQSPNTEDPLAEDDYFIQPPLSGIGYVEPGNDILLYTGSILLPIGIYKGQMLIDDSGTIIYIGRNAEDYPESIGATKLTCAYGLAVPGFIDAWRHTTFAGGTLTTILGDEKFEHRHDWRKGLRGHTAISYTNPGIPYWDEIGLIMTGTTTVMGTASGGSGLVRNLRSGSVSEGLIDALDTNEIDTFPLGDAAGDQTVIPGNYPDLPSWPGGVNELTYSLIISEGIDEETRNEFLTLSNATYVDILSDTTNVVHGLGLKSEDYKLMADAGASLVWTPKSDLFLYGNTAMVTVFDTLGGNITLGSTWSISGSINTLLEIQTAAFFNKTYLNNYFTEKDIIDMATINAAKAYKIDDLVGSLELGKIADFSVFDTRNVSELDAVLDADQSKIALVFRSGTPLYGSDYLIDDLRSDYTNSETFVIGTDTKRIYTIGEIGPTIAELEASASPDPLPLVYDASSLDTKILPARPLEYSGVITGSDSDGDGIPNNVDNAPDTFNPVRPLDGGVQADCDGDGIGDVADSTPLP